MARRGIGCGGHLIRALISFVIIIVVLAGAFAGVFYGTSPSTFGITKIANIELGELADMKFSELWKVLKSLKSPDVTKIIDFPITDEMLEQEHLLLYGDGTTPGILDEMGIADKPESLFKEPVVVTTATQMTFNGSTFAVLANDIIDNIDSNPEYAFLLEIINLLKDNDSDPAPAEIMQFQFFNDGGNLSVKIVVSLKIKNIKDQLPGYLKSLLGDIIYVTVTNGLTLNLDGTLTAAPNTSVIKVNDLSNAISKAIISSLIDTTGLTMSQGEAAISLLAPLLSIINNIGHVGTLNNSIPAPFTVVTPYAITNELPEYGGTITLVLHTELCEHLPPVVTEP